MAEKTNITKDTPPQVIEEDIARTRDEMAETMTAIQQKVSPGRWKEKTTARIKASTVDKVRDAASRFSETAKGTGSTIVDTVRSNPIPIALMSVGFAWLLYNRTRESNGDVLAERGEALKEKASEISEKTRAKTGELSERARQKGSELAGRAKYSASRLTEAAQERARGAQNRFQQMIRDNPFGLTLAALAVGAAVGFSIPESRKEKELMGAASGSLMERAKETAQKTIQKAQHAAEKAVQTAGAEFK